ncbi:D-alanyl-D-alanine carboxypeptidase/D-alanyl-D-alanine endopeptidase [Horticoccus sp. 23ND18S-11]|uniref:D-alanyl-D-alanine carboxypeptidase/D-alanyl-D-alanine endopeptidase n=1 Tax=Horticoccus sp. 23ND18S-11 TaxID=3391832 RepID=UPI0039C98759
MKRNSHGWWTIGFPLLAFLTVAVAQAAEAVVEAATSLPELRQQLDAHVNQPRFAGALWGVKVASVDSGQTVFEHQPIRLMSPASNSKLYTGALALDRFGGDFRIVTPILATAKPDAAGRIAGDLIVSGRGDPSWKAKPRGGDFWRTFDPFIAVLKQAGVRHIAGAVVGDATFFHSPAYGAGWVVEDLTDDYGAELSALTLEENFIDVRVTPAAIAGQPCQVEVLYPLSGLVFLNRTVTAPEGTARSLHSWRAPGGNIVYLFGEMPVGGAEHLLDVTIPQPERWFAATLREALIRAGITVGGEARIVRWPEASPVPQGAVKLGELTSPPLRDMVAAFMKPSQNLETDLIFAQVGEAVRPADAPLWRTTEPLAVGALRDFLSRSGLPADEVRFDEGSGLSRNNLTSANATVALLRFMAAHREAKAFAESLPIAGVDGSLRRRMKATAAEGNVLAKTGTLRWASSLSGYVTTAAGERLAFSAMLNRSVTPTGRFAREDVDAIAVMLAGFRGRIDVGGVNLEARKP